MPQTLINIRMIFILLMVINCNSKIEKIDGLANYKIYKPNKERVFIDNKSKIKLNSWDVYAYNSDSDLVKYSYLSIQDSIMFEINYQKDSVYGMPFVFALWDNNTDSIKVEFEFVRPPFIEYYYYINNNLIQFHDSSNVVFYSNKRGKGENSLNLKAVFYYKDKKWKTFKRTQSF